MSLLPSARFHTTVAQLRQLPRDGLPEIAFVGRSNAGKSSAINVLCQRKRLAFASRTPGRTQALNFFALGAEDRIDALLVDTPGYGYAAAPGDVKRAWEALGGRYLREREPLRAVVLIMDIRRQVTDLDRSLLDWIGPEMPLLVIASKADKLNRDQTRRALAAIDADVAACRGADNFLVVPFSATARVGIEETREILEGWLARAIAQVTPDPTEQTSDSHPVRTKKNPSSGMAGV